MKNNSNVPIEFKVTLKSLDPESRKDNELKRFLNSNDLKYKSHIGPNNYSGYTNFDAFPIHGSLQPGKKQFKSITVFNIIFYSIFLSLIDMA